MYNKTKSLFAAFVFLLLSEAYAGPISVVIKDSNGNPVDSTVSCNPYFTIDINSGAPNCIAQIVWGNPQSSWDCTAVSPPRGSYDYSFNCTCPTGASFPLPTPETIVTCGNVSIVYTFDITGP